jgi:Ran-binding protein 9/10
LNTQPGWQKGSWGYHGDDGFKFDGDGIGEPYGPTFTTDDVIGCGIDFKYCIAFYTKNGALLDAAFTELMLDRPDKPGKDLIYPMVGMHSEGEKARLNFGKQPFKFDIREHIIRTKAIRKKIPSWK